MMPDLTPAELRAQQDGRYPRLIYEGGSQIWLKVLVDGVDREIEVPGEIAWDWLIRLPGWLKRIASM